MTLGPDVCDINYLLHKRKILSLESGKILLLHELRSQDRDQRQIGASSYRFTNHSISMQVPTEDNEASL
jgi:hypothetical protein